MVVTEEETVACVSWEEEAVEPEKRWREGREEMLRDFSDIEVAWCRHRRNIQELRFYFLYLYLSSLR